MFCFVKKIKKSYKKIWILKIKDLSLQHQIKQNTI